MLTLALLAALAAGLAFRLLPAEAAACSQPYCGYPTVCPTSWTGSSLSETRYGSICVDQMDGAGGDDRLFGKEEGDKLVGGSGNDTVWGESGNDTISGGIDNDPISGGSGNDRIDPNPGGDTVNASDGDDTIYLGKDGSVDTIDGGLGTDTVWYVCHGSFEQSRDQLDRLSNVENVLLGPC